MKTNPFTERLRSEAVLSQQSIRNLKEIEEIDNRIEFLDNIKIGTMKQNNDKDKAWQVLLIIAIFAFCAFYDDFLNLIF